jgi:hypothetical protein
MTTPPSPDFLARLSEIPDPVAGRGSAPARPAAHPRSPDRVRTRTRRLLAVALSLGWLTLHLVLFGLRGDLHQLPDAYLGAQVLLPVLLAAGSLAIALASGRLGLGVSLGLVTLFAVLGPASFALVAGGAPVPSAPAPDAGSLAGALVCFNITIFWAAFPMLLAVLTLRGAFPVGAKGRGALVGAAAGLLAGATINLHCANVAPFHMLIGHGIPVAIATVIGAFVVSRWARS